MVHTLTQSITAFLSKQYSTHDLFVQWTVPDGLSHGHLSTPSALRFAKEVGVSPKEIAQMMCDVLQGVPCVERSEVAGPGFVNVWLTPEALLAQLEDVLPVLQPQKTRDEDPVIVEYSQPNIAKPLGIHHIMSTIIGQSIANLYQYLGYNTIRVNHFGDWGTQFGKLAVALERWGEKPVKDCSIDELLALYVRFHDELENDPTLHDAARDTFRRLEEGDQQLRAFWKDVVAVTMDALNRLYERLHVSIEHPHGESMYEDMMAPILEEGLRKGVFTKGEKGAVVIEFPEEMKLPTAVVQKGDSATIYMTRDFAQIRYRIDRWHPHAMYYVVDHAQSLHFQQLFTAVKMLGWELPHLEHIAFGRMRFREKSMSTRKGNILKLEEVLDEAHARAKRIIEERGDAVQTDDPEALAEMMGVGSVIYGVLSQNRKQDVTFDWGSFLSFDGNSAPYVQYTYARSRSVLRKGKWNGEHVLSNVSTADLSETEHLLLKVLMQFPHILEEARSSHMPHILTNYLFELCQRFNAFYNSDPILQSPPPLKGRRLLLTSFVSQILKTGGELLCLRFPESM